MSTLRSLADLHVEALGLAESTPKDNGKTTPTDRATTFQAVEGGGETRSGETLLVEAYAVLWLILMGYVAWMWKRQGAITQRLGALEGALDRAAAGGSDPGATKPDESAEDSGKSKRGAKDTED